MFRIGELAKRCNIKADTLRFYEKHGLLAPSHRTDSGYRVYSEADADKLRFILRAKAVGFTLAEITELLSIEVDRSNRACADVKGLVDDKLDQVLAKIDELTHFKMSLQKLSQACCGGPESAEHCSILEALESSDSLMAKQASIKPQVSCPSSTQRQSNCHQHHFCAQKQSTVNSLPQAAKSQSISTVQPEVSEK